MTASKETICLYWPPHVLLQQVKKMQKRSLWDLRAHQPDYWGRWDLADFHTEFATKDRTSAFISEYTDRHSKSGADELTGCIANSTLHLWFLSNKFPLQGHLVVEIIMRPQSRRWALSRRSQGLSVARDATDQLHWSVKKLDHMWLSTLLPTQVSKGLHTLLQRSFWLWSKGKYSPKQLQKSCVTHIIQTGTLSPWSSVALWIKPVKTKLSKWTYL